MVRYIGHQLKLCSFLFVFVNAIGLNLDLANAKEKIENVPFPVRYWKQIWHNRTRDVSLMYSDEIQAIFVDNQVIRTASQLQLVRVPDPETKSFLSQAQKTNSALSLRDNLPLYVLMQREDYSSLTSNKNNLRKTCNFQNTTDCKQSDFDEGTRIDTATEIEVKKSQEKITQSYGDTINHVKEWRIVDLLAYDELVQTNRVETATWFRAKLMDSTTDFPQEGITLFSDWYFPIYEQYGGSRALQNFVGLTINVSGNRNDGGGKFTTKTMSPGKFVHWWSQAVGSDLRDLAGTSFGWIPEYRMQFEEARTPTQFYNYADTYPSASAYTPPQHWLEHWNNHTKNLTLALANEHIALYHDDDTPATGTWAFKFVSDTWNYFKKHYGPLGSDPHLYIALHNGDTDYCSRSKTLSYLDKTYDSRFVLDCTTSLPFDWKKKTNYNQDFIVHEVAGVAYQAFKETGNWQKTLNVRDELLAILVYDAYLALNETEDASRYKEGLYLQNTLVFLDWFFPIYNKYGGSGVLQRFFNMMYLHWPRKGTDFVGTMNKGEFVHFWSGAAGEDLTHVAYTVFKWTEDDGDTLIQARIDYPQFNYSYVPPISETQMNWKEHWNNHKEELTLVFANEHVAFYFDPYINASITWPFELLSNAWEYAKSSYGPLGNDTLLYVVLHGQRTATSCTTSRRESYIDWHFDNRLVIDCEVAMPMSWDVESPANSDNVLYALGRVILRNAHGTGNWPGYRISRAKMALIIVYDIYKQLNRTSDAIRWMHKCTNQTENIFEGTTHLFRDWYYPIYETYGGALTFKNFFATLHSHWPHKDHDYTHNFDLGTMVHLWSGAVGENLWHLAAEAFGWGVWNHRKFLNAREELSNISYPDTFKNSTLTVPLEEWEEQWEDHHEEVNLVYVDGNIAVYYDNQMDFTITWFLPIVSNAWSYIKKTYGPVGDDPHLYLVLHDGKFESCRTSRGRNSYVDKAYSNRTVLDCGLRYDSWTNPSGLSLIMKHLGHVVLRGAKQTGFWPTLEIDRLEMGEILIYDVYNGIGETQKAEDWLQSNLLKTSNNYYYRNTSWFRDWHYPVYAQFGYFKVLNRFLSLLHQWWPKKKTGYDYLENLNVGEFVHFWSGAAGVNLQHLAQKTIGWRHEYEVELEIARANYSQIIYKASHADGTDKRRRPLLLTENWFDRTGLVFRTYMDDDISVYFGASMNRSVLWPSKIISRTWQKINAFYSTMHSFPDNSLITILHADKELGCQTLNDAIGNTTTIIYCSAPSKKEWQVESYARTHELLNEFAFLIQNSNNKQKEVRSRNTISDMTVFDMYLNLRRFDEAHKLLNKIFEEKEIQNGAGNYWISDWVLPVYTHYGGVALLDKFLSDSKERAILSTSKKGKNKNTNTGQTIHFWSAAAGENLYKTAKDAFGTNHIYEEEFTKAKKDFKLGRYSCFDCPLYDNVKKGSEGSSAVVYILAGIITVVIATTLVLLLAYHNKLSNLQEHIRELTTDEIQEFFEGKANADLTNGDSSIASKPFDKAYELAKDQLEISHENVLGSGEFGLVIRGKIKAPEGSEEDDQLVAVKTVKPNVDVDFFKSLLMELKVLGYLGTHENIASLLGASTLNIKSREVYVAMEFCEKGDLLDFVKKNCAGFKDLFSKSKPEPESQKATDVGNRLTVVPELIRAASAVSILIGNSEAPTSTSSIGPPAPFSTLDLIQWSQQIAKGMDYISSKQVVHGDLAARNILITAGNVAKISDFGLSRQLINYSNYTKTSKTPVPWRWMSVEALRDMSFSVESDIWAFGVTLYEIFTLGTVPYAGWTWDYEFIDKLDAGHRLSAPEFSNEEIYNLMMDCMAKEPKDRLIFSAIADRLQVLKTIVSMESGVTSGANSDYVRLT